MKERTLHTVTLTTSTPGGVPVVRRMELWAYSEDDALARGLAMLDLYPTHAHDGQSNAKLDTHPRLA